VTRLKIPRPAKNCGPYASELLAIATVASSACLSVCHALREQGYKSNIFASSNRGDKPNVNKTILAEKKK